MRISRTIRRNIVVAGSCCCGILSSSVILAATLRDAAAVATNISTLSTNQVLTPKYLEKNNAVIGNVTIDNQNIFDLEDPDENKWLYRLANGIHATTRPEVVQAQLLFETGTEYSNQQIEETKRLLRKNRYIHDAEIEYVNYEDGVVDLNVQTKDVWTLKADVSFGRSGGVNTGGFGLEEHNLLGTGVYLGAMYKSTVDRDITSFEYADTHFRGTDYTLAGVYASNSDGHDRQLSVFKPFIALNSYSAGGVMFQSGERIDSLYDLGGVQAEFNHQSQYFEAFRGWSKGLKNGWARRLTAGLAYDSHSFASVPDSTYPVSTLPSDRQFLYPFVGLEVVEDQFETATNFDQINRTEDRYLGTRYSVRLGYSPANNVSTRGTALYQAEYRTGIKLDKAESLLTGITMSGRMEGSQFSNTLVSAFATYHRRQSDKRLFFANLTANVGDNLDLDNPVSLGGATGLRGYPLRYQSGTRSAVLTLEQRVFTDWYPFHLFHIGGAVFFDAGRAWGKSPTGGENLGLLKDIGFGLRIANTRSSIGRVMHIDIAYPLDGDKSIKSVQFLLEAKRSF